MQALKNINVPPIAARPSCWMTDTVALGTTIFPETIYEIWLVAREVWTW